MARPSPTPCRVCSRLCVSNKFSHFRQKTECACVCVCVCARAYASINQPLTAHSAGELAIELFRRRGSGAEARASTVARGLGRAFLRLSILSVCLSAPAPVAPRAQRVAKTSLRGNARRTEGRPSKHHSPAARGHSGVPPPVKCGPVDTTFSVACPSRMLLATRPQKPTPHREHACA